LGTPAIAELLQGKLVVGNGFTSNLVWWRGDRTSRLCRAESEPPSSLRTLKSRKSQPSVSQRYKTSLSQFTTGWRDRTLDLDGHFFSWRNGFQIDHEVIRARAAFENTSSTVEPKLQTRCRGVLENPEGLHQCAASRQLPSAAGCRQATLIAYGWEVTAWPLLILRISVGLNSPYRDLFVTVKDGREAV